VPIVRYEKFQPLKNAELALDYLTNMVDAKCDYLPYWLVAPHENPAFAKHCRVDDAELVASWYEAIVAVRRMLGTDRGSEVEDGFYRHLMKSWAECGLRFHEPYPWSHTNHSSFHEMSYVLSALNRRLANHPDDRRAAKRASALVRGMRKLVIERKTKTFWSGDFAISEPVYEFPNDVYIRGRGFDMTCHTGRGEQPIRNGMMLHALVMRWEQAGDKVAKDLAVGIANHLLGVSRYFNWKMEFFGHVHSAVWVASGLVRLGRLSGTERYVAKGKAIYDYVRSLSSSFGWVPEYAQWHPPDEEHCETCCIKDMIQCAGELIDAGFHEYYNDMGNFARNQLVENQIKDGCFVAVDNSIPDTADTTWRDLDKRIVGGFSGGSEPNSISLLRFRSIAGCCAGTAPQALEIVWDRSVEYKRGRLTVNIPVDKKLPQGQVEIGYPNQGFIRATTSRPCDVAIRVHPWMPKRLTALVNGRKRAIRREDGLILFKRVGARATVEVRHVLRTRRVREHFCGRDWTALWRGPDVVDLLPHGKPLRLYQRIEGKAKIYPRAPKHKTTGKGHVAAPTQQKN